MASLTPSNFVEYTFQSVYRCLAGQLSMDPDVLRTCLRLRIPKLRNCTDPFPKPSVTSSAAIRSGSVGLPDGTTLQVDDHEAIIWKISERFNLDEIEAYILLRSFLYNEQLEYNPTAKEDEASSAEESLLESITDFLFEERLFVLRIFPPLYRAQADDQHLYHDIAVEILHEVAPDPTALVSTLVSQYIRRTKQEIPSKQPRKTTMPLSMRAKWAKQIVKEQICMMEIIFWGTYNMRCPGSLIAELYEAVYSTSLGSAQHNGDVLLEEESIQLLADLESVMVVTAVQVLGVELLNEQSIDLEVVSLPRHGYFAQPAELERIHSLVCTTPTQPRFSPIVLAWTCVIRRIASAAESDNYPQEYVPLMATLAPEQGGRDSVWQEFTRVVLNPAMGLFPTLRSLLSSPLLDTEAAATAGSSISNPNDNVVRAIIKGLVIGLTELIRVEYIEDFDSLVEVWILLFGSGEWTAVAPLCSDFWRFDMHHQSLNRRALLEITRDRFPVQARPFIRVLRSLSATGGFQGLEGYVQERELDYNRGGSASAVYHYFDALPSYAITIPSDDKPDLKALFEMRNTTAGLVYSNNRPLRLPGGSILPARSQGTVISDGDARSPVVVMWQHKHSGWKFALALLKDYVKRRQIAAGGPRNKLVPSITPPTAANSSKAVDLRFEDIGLEEGLGNQELVTDILELFRSVLRNNHTLTPFLMQALLPEDDADLSGWERASLLEVIPLLLQDVLHTTSVGAGSAPTRLVTNILGVMTTLLPHHPGSLWTSLRSSTLLFGDVRRAGSTPALLSFERRTGSYPMTLALLDLVRALFDESVRTMYQVPLSFSTMKTEVLLRALAFLHNEIWIDFNNWKYTNLGQKFQIGSKIAVLFAETLTQAPSFPLESESRASPDDAHSTLLAVARFTMTAFFTQSIASTINPLVLVIASGHMTREALYRTRRFSDAHYLDGFVESSLLLCRLVLVRKATVTTTKPSLLEQGLFVGVSAGAFALDHHRPRLNPVDTIVSHYVRPPNGIKIQLEAVKLLTALCVSVSKCQPSPPSMLGHLSDAESVVDFLLKVVHNADDEPAMRLAVWAFISAAIDTQPALATFFLSGKASSFPTDQTSGNSAAASPRVPSLTAIDAADQTIQRWKTLSEQNPALLASTLSFLDLVWQHAHEHTNVIESLRKNHGLWKEFSELVKEKLDIPPTTEVKDMMEIDGLRRSGLHEAVSNHAYLTMSKAHVIHLIALDLTFPRQPPSEPGVSSLSIVTELFEDPDRLSRILSEAIFNPFDATLHEQTRESLESLFPNFTLESVRAVTLPSDRAFGDDYIFPSLIVEERLHQYAVGDAELQRHQLKVYKGILSLNLDWSLIDSYISLTRSWSVLLHGVSSVLRERKPSQQSMLSAASSVATAIAQETRSGPVAVAVHAERLRLLLGLFDATWLYAPTFEEVIKLMAPIQALVSHEVHRPIHSVSGVITPSFHQSLLQLIYYCTRKVRMIGLNTLPAVKRSIVTSTVSAALQFVIEALRSVFEQAHEVNSDILDEDMQLLVATFEECIRTDLGASQSLWLSQLQSTSLIRLSLELLAKVDIAGVQQPSVLRLRRYPYYARHIFQFHLALATLPASAERLAHEGVMVCYVSNTLAPVLEIGGVDVTHVAHHSWCTIVAIVTALTCVLGTSNGHFVNAEIVGFVQLYGAQLSKVLSWKVGDPLSIPLLQEMEAVILFFHAIATSTSSRPRTDHGALDILRAYGERALFLLQQLNSALSYPNQLSSSLEPLSAIEQTLFEKESDLGRVGSSIDFLDNGTRPILASVVQKLIMSASTILCTLAITSGSDKILTRSESVPSADILLISLSSKVSPDEPATIGTLIELGNWAVQLLVHLLKPAPASPSTQPLIPPSVIPSPFVRKTTIHAARSVIEGLMVYAATQLSRWLERDRTDEPFEANILTSVNGREDLDVAQSRGKRGRHSVPMMNSSLQSAVQDQARDLNLLATRAKEVLGKLADDDGGSALILLEVLIGFASAKLLKMIPGGR